MLRKIYAAGLLGLALVLAIRLACAQEKPAKLPKVAECVEPCKWALHQGFMIFKAGIEKDGHCLCVGILPNGPDEEKREDNP